MQKKRLLRLASWLERIAKNPPKTRKFNLSRWCRRLPKYERTGRFSKCGTVCCAVGEASLIPEFKQAGFRIPYKVPKFEGRAGWEAVERFFGLSYHDATYLFMEDSYVGRTGPDRVAARIREFVQYCIGRGYITDVSEASNAANKKAA
jgi:hypothetical protein